MMKREHNSVPAPKKNILVGLRDRFKSVSKNGCLFCGMEPPSSTSFVSEVTKSAREQLISIINQVKKRVMRRIGMAKVIIIDEEMIDQTRPRRERNVAKHLQNLSPY
jgi:hypothetical protein